MRARAPLRAAAYRVNKRAYHGRPRAAATPTANLMKLLGRYTGSIAV